MTDHTIPVSVVGVEALEPGTPLFWDGAPVVVLTVMPNGAWVCETEHVIHHNPRSFRVATEDIAIDLTRKLGQVVVAWAMKGRLSTQKACTVQAWRQMTKDLACISAAKNGTADPAQLKALAEQLADH